MKTASLILALAFASELLAQRAGDLDSTFGVLRGMVITDIINQNNVTNDNSAYSAAKQSDGKIVVVGDVPNIDFAIVRYLSNGSLDSTFGVDGVVLTDFYQRSGGASSVAIQLDGKIVVVGFIVAHDTTWHFAIARYNTDGSLDTSFGIGGRLIAAFEGSAHSVALQSDGKIVVAGDAYDRNTPSADFCVARFSPNGSLDSSFGIDGKVVTEAFVWAEYGIESIALQSDGKIVAAGVGAGGNGSFLLVRYNYDGTVDSTFGTNGIAITTFIGEVRTIVMQPDGKILAGGNSVMDANLAATLVRYNIDGALDTSFGLGGIGRAYFDENSFIHSIALQSDLKVVAVGYCTRGFNEDFALIRYNIDGSLDSAFGTNGKSTTALGGNSDDPRSVIIQNDKKIVVVGSTDIKGDIDFILLRYLSENLNVGIVEFSESENNVLIYPNPIGETATLEYSLASAETITIRLLDMQGKTVNTFIENTTKESGSHQQAITLPASLPAGSYVIVIESGKGRMGVKVTKL